MIGAVILEIEILLVLIGTPFCLTTLNIVNLFFKKQWISRITEMLTIFLGGILYLFLGSFLGLLDTFNYDVAIPENKIHSSIYSENFFSFTFPCIVGLIGLILLCLSKPQKLPPLISAISIAAVLIGNVMNVLYAIQLFANYDWPMLFLWLYHFNLLLISIREIYRHICEQVQYIQEQQIHFRHKGMKKLYQMLSSISRMRIFCFVLVFPLAAVMEIILILFGQGADGVIKAFTMTADWTFSTQIPPPPLAYEGHYLCTVAAGGHKKVVHPQRYGIRLDEKIVVNRQLCIANAFEELIQERLPQVHKYIRRFYNQHGYPISRLITTPLKADIVYILMKPLEWLFLLVLYLWDCHPENRIAVQYMGKGFQKK